jgi:low temperature requirement protein LtrA
LIVIVLGEIVVNGIDDFVANYSVQTVVDTLLVLSISFGLFYLYFRAEIGSHLKHALRRHKLSAILWSIIHLPISISFVSIASCLSGMLEISTKAYLGKGSQTVTYEHQSITAASFAASFYCLSALGLLHLDRPVTPSKRKLAFVPTISKLNRTVFRLFLGTLILVLGLTINIQASTWIYFTSLLCLFAVCVEEYGRTKYHQY